MKLFYQKFGKSEIVYNNEWIFKYLYTFEEKEFVKQLSLWNFGNNQK